MAGRKTSFVFGLGALMMALNVCAQSAPPALPPVALPPIPGGNYPPPPTTAPTPSATSDATPSTQKEQQTQYQYQYDVFLKNMVTEATRMHQALEGVMGFWFNTTDSAAFREMKLKGKFSDAWTSKDPHFALISYYQKQNPLNSNEPSMCMIALDPEQARNMFERFVTPVLGKTHDQSAYAFAIAHATGHCMDYAAREGAMRKQMAWTASDSGKIGLLPEVVSKTLGDTYSKDAYASKPFVVHQHSAQKQYEERVADSFATGWVLKLGASSDAVRIFEKSLSDTASSMSMMAQDTREIERLQGIETLFAMARSVQMRTGADVVAHDIRQESTASTGVVRYIVTPHGLVGVDALGRVVDDVGTTQNTPRNFNTLPRFGSN